MSIETREVKPQVTVMYRGDDMDRIKPEKSPLSEIDHIGVVVGDMDKAIEHYQSLGIGPFERLKNVSLVQSKVLGKPIEPDDIKLKARIARMGPVGYELIQPVAGESLWKEFLETKGEGINHMAFLVDDIDQGTAELEEKGFKVLWSTRFQNGGGAAYFDTAQVGGVILELVQWPPG